MTKNILLLCYTDYNTSPRAPCSVMRCKSASRRCRTSSTPSTSSRATIAEEWIIIYDMKQWTTWFTRPANFTHGTSVVFLLFIYSQRDESCRSANQFTCLTFTLFLFPLAKWMTLRAPPKNESRGGQEGVVWWDETKKDRTKKMKNSLGWRGRGKKNSGSLRL